MHSNLQGLYGITDQTLMPNTQALLKSVEQSLLGGTRIIQYRDKSDDASKRLDQAEQLSQLCQRFNASFLINDDIELAYNCGADGVHLGQRDGDIADARALLGPNAIIGMTCHDSIDFAIKAEQEGANYVAFGAFFSSKTKPKASPAPMSLITDAKAQIKLPLVAIGGISMDNAQHVITAGADMIAVVHALYAQDDIQLASQAFDSLFKFDSER